MLYRVALIAVVALVVPPPIMAQERPLILVASGSHGDPVVEALREELMSEGWRVEVVAVARTSALSAAASERGARATVLVAHGGETIELRADDYQRSVIRTGDDVVAALRAVEIIRAWLAPIEDGGSEEPVLGPTASGWLGLGFVLSPGGIDAHLAIVLGAELRVVQRAYLEVFGSIAVPGTYITQRMIELSLFTASAGAGIGYSFLEETELLALRAAVGIGFLTIVVDGQRDSWGAMPYLRLAAGLRLIPEVALRLDTVTALALPELELTFRAGGRATFGLPLVALTLAIELTL